MSQLELMCDCDICSSGFDCGGGSMSEEEADAFEAASAGPAISAHRVRGLAGVLAGFRWPGRGSFEALKKGQQAAALRVAREALEALEREPD